MWSLPGFPQPEQMGTKPLVSACLPCPPGSISLMAEDLYPNAIGWKHRWQAFFWRPFCLHLVSSFPVQRLVWWQLWKNRFFYYHGVETWSIELPAYNQLQTHSFWSSWAAVHTRYIFSKAIFTHFLGLPPEFPPGSQSKGSGNSLTITLPKVESSDSSHSQNKVMVSCLD